MRVESLTAPGCDHGAPTEELLRRVLTQLVPGATLLHTEVRSAAQAEQLGFPGSPSIRIDGLDLEARTAERCSVGCRLYGDAAAPPQWLIEAAILRALRPRHVLFMCVANSARSQLAEGVARSLAPTGVKISSAGSQPTLVRPEAIAALAEVGIDIAGHFSKTTEQVDAASVEAVITLCAEQVCPTFLGRAHRLHWGLPDPAAVREGPERQRAFATTRDELRQRLAVLFAPQAWH